jgi:hypothetical protein
MSTYHLDQILDLLEEDSVILEPRERFDPAILGETGGMVAYSYERLVTICYEEGGVEWVDFNIACLPNIVMITEVIGEDDEVEKIIPSKED